MVAAAFPFLMILVGFALLIKGADLLVEGASAVARRFKVSEMAIGLTVVAVGTSLPDLATSVMAARKGNADIAAGNVDGPTIFNILYILGISAMIQPLPFRAESNLDIGAILLATILLFIFMFTGRRHTLDRWEGVLFAMLYCGYASVLALHAI